MQRLYDQELAEKVIEDERKIHLSTLAEARMIKIAVNKYIEILISRKEQQAQDSKAEAFDDGNKRLVQNVNLTRMNSEVVTPTLIKTTLKATRTETHSH